ncbi:precorrin-3B C(17)-methyltransferase [Parendozoicomonas haliclonae]|uniref:Cobalt-precorrin-3B C(17)-methyltransferase n=1 Tax=Parendozoicomonas haliclonae TaxID=1960125 RepID=A0A1X7ALX5_9GAMM|nr:precorrin-3B C(17)-methyltransferase [Parendozoicomonas haliclonae]SMA48826.1 Cobalt-precorrin-3B C(17)-methyltransferase [Parendozoicomonas haliclonae]
MGNTAKGQLSVVSIGPGSLDLMAPMARKAIENADYVVGYKTYIELIEDLCSGKTLMGSAMTQEVERANQAVDLAEEGYKVALISSGDAGMYAMGSLALELLQERNWTRADGIGYELIPGITAANSCASLVGVPLGHDSCTISLSDLLTPWEVITKRIRAAAEADFAITFYNPQSKRRRSQIVEARDILLQHRPANTPVAIVQGAYRDNQKIVITDLEHFLDYDIGMLAAVTVGNSSSYLFEGMIVTPRGYTKKYDITDGSIYEGQKRGRTLNVEALSDQNRATDR